MAGELAPGSASRSYLSSSLRGPSFRPGSARAGIALLTRSSAHFILSESPIRVLPPFCSCSNAPMTGSATLPCQIKCPQLQRGHLRSSCQQATAAALRVGPGPEAQQQASGQGHARPAAPGISRSPPGFSRASPVAASSASASGTSGSVAVRTAVPRIEAADALQVETDERGEVKVPGPRPAWGWCKAAA